MKRPDGRSGQQQKIEQYQGEIDQRTLEINEHEEGLLVALMVAANNREEVSDLISSHTPRATKICDEAAKNNGVDQGSYHGGSFVGNHCISYCNNCIPIFREIRHQYAMDATVTAEQIELVDDILNQWEEILRAAKDSKDTLPC